MTAVQKFLRLMGPTAPSRSFAQVRHGAVVVPVLLLHGALLWLLTQAHPDRSDVAAAAASGPMVLRWIEAVTAVVPLPIKPVAGPVPTQPPRVAASTITPAAPNLTSSVRPSEAAPITMPSGPAEVEPTAVQTARPTAAPLDLNLRRHANAPTSARSPASLATQDGRSNSERASFGEKLADALGSDDRRTEENLGGGRIRFRSGTDCVEVHESRAGQLDPMSQTSRPAPRGAKACK